MLSGSVTADIKPIAPKPKKRRWKIVLAILLVFTTILYSLILRGKAFINETVANIQYIPSDQEILPPTDLMEEDGTINVLFIGTDENEAEFSDMARADSIMIASVNVKTGKASLISLERGIGVHIDGVGEDWLTHVFAYGGADLLVRTVSEYFNLDISHYARVNFYAFKNIIDIFGGVDIYLSQEEVDALETMSGVKLKVGKNHLNGDVALSYARLRSIDSDFKRVERQRNIIQAIVYEFSDIDYTEMYQLSQQILPYVQTNISHDELKSLVVYLPNFLGVRIDQMTIPQDEDKLPGKTLNDGRIITQIDFEESSRKIHKQIYGNKIFKYEPVALGLSINQ